MSMIPASVLDVATDAILDTGVRVLQGARMAPTEAGHVGKLLQFFRPGPGSHIVDLGCGVGEVANLMSEIDPSLGFTLVNNHRYQLGLCPTQFRSLLCDMHEIPVDDGTFDAGMFCYSLCHADIRRALAEAARVIRRGGPLLVYDYERMGGDDDLFSRLLYSTALSRQRMAATAGGCGWEIEEWIHPIVDDQLFRQAFKNDALYNQIFDDLRVCLWRARRL